MGHYKANLRDIEFNLFEVLDARTLLGTRPVRGRRRRHRARDPRRGRRGSPRTSSPRRCSTPTATRRSTTPRPTSVTMPESFKKSYQAYVDAEWWRIDVPAELGGTVVPAVAALGDRRDRPRRQPRRAHVLGRASPSRACCTHIGTDEQKQLAAAHGRQRVGRHDGAHRARRRLRRRRRPHQGRAAARRHLAHHRRQALHHLRRARHDRQRRPLRAGPPRGRRPRHQGPVASSSCRSSTSTSRPASSASATAPSSPTSSTRWASRSPPRARSASARSTDPRGRHPARRRARRHRADVPDHRVRPDDGRHQGDRDALDRLPERARYAKERVQGADLTQMTDKTAPRVTITHHPDVRRSLMLQKAYAEGLRALVLYTASQQDTVSQAQSGDPAATTRAGLRRRPRATGSTTCCCRIVKGVGSERAWVLLGTETPADLRRLRLPAGLPDRAVRPRRQDRHPLRGHDGDPGPRLLLPQDRARQGPGAAAPRGADAGVRQGDIGPARSPPSASCWARRSRTSRASSATWSASSWRPTRAVGGDAAQPLQGRPEHHAAAAGHRRPRRRLAAAAPGRGRHRRLAAWRVGARTPRSTEGKIAAASFFAGTCCRRSRPSARSPRRPTTT